MQRTFNKAERKPYFRNGSLGVDVATSTLWTPYDITTSLWLDASDASTITIATGVSQWNDKSGNARNATQSTGANQPAVVTNAFNGLQVIRFDGSNDSFDYDGSFVDNTSYTVFTIVARRNNASNNYFLAGSTNDINNQLIVGFQTNTTFTLAQYGNDLNATISGYTSSVLELYEASHNTISGKIIRKFGTQIAINNNTTSIIGNSGGKIGTFPAISSFYNGDIGELIFLTTTPSTEIRQKMEGYLAWKWGLVSDLPNDHPYKNAAPTI